MLYTIGNADRNRSQRQHDAVSIKICKCQKYLKKNINTVD